MKYIVTIKYTDFEFESAEEAVDFATMAKMRFKSNKYDTEIPVTIAIMDEKDIEEEEAE